jgi:hypothetical protein
VAFDVSADECAGALDLCTEALTGWRAGLGLGGISPLPLPHMADCRDKYIDLMARCTSDS